MVSDQAAGEPAGGATQRWYSTCFFAGGGFREVQKLQVTERSRARQNGQQDEVGEYERKAS
jgi:hypothetical protein